MRSLTVCLFAVLAVPIAGPARAQELSVADAAALLDAPDADQVRLGIESLGLSGSAQAVAPLAARVRRGLPAELLDVAVDTLVVLARPECGPVLMELMQHRRAAIRLKAIQGLVAIRPRGADAALVAALSDQDATVRGAAAQGLGTVGTAASIEPLFHALDRGVLEAATALGQICRAADVRRLLAEMARVPFDAMTPALSEILARRDLPERPKLDVIARLSELATPGVKQYLTDFVATLPATDRSTVRRAAEDAIRQIRD